MCRVNPKIDIIFRKLFGSEENKDILLSLINSIMMLEQPIKEIILKNPYNFNEYIASKKSILDIKGKDELGTWYDIELQIAEQGFYGKRALYYLSKIYSDQIESGSSYNELKPAIGIHLLDFHYFPDENRYYRHCLFKDEETNEVYDVLKYMDLYFIEMSKFKKEIGDLGTILDKWIYFFNKAHEIKKGKIPSELREDEIKKAIEKLDIMYLDEKERANYEAERKSLWDYKEVIRTAQEKGRIEGEAKGEIKAILEIKFGNQGLKAMEQIYPVQDIDALKQILTIAKDVIDLKAFKKKFSSLKK